MKIVFFIFKVINTLIPKSAHKIIFISRPDFADNAKHMYSYMQKKSPQKQLSWLIYDKEIYDILIQNGHQNIFYLKSILGVWEYLRSKTIITSSSSLWQIKSPMQKQYDLWHGIPLKNVLCMGEKNTKPIRQAGNITMRFATSNLVKALLSASFDFNAVKIAVTGQPRTDVFFKENKSLSKLIDEDPTGYSKVLFYMPTYRRGFRDKKEGSAFEIDNIFRMPGYDHQRFIDYLEQNNILFLLKLHPYEENLYCSVMLSKNIKWIKHKTLVESDIELHEIFNQIDILITDYSSVYFDFLLLDKRVIFVPIDLDYYEKERGFAIEPYTFWTPGSKVIDQSALELEILKKDTILEKEHRKTVRDVMFHYQDNLSSERIYEHIVKGM